MSSNAHVLLGNGAANKARRLKGWVSASTQQLSTFGPQKNVRLIITDLTDRMAARLSDRVHDLVELAALVYAADQSCKRLAGVTPDYGDRWRRALRFELAVRDLDFWHQADVRECLAETLGFLSDDHYEFVFSKLEDPPPFQQYLEFDARRSDPDPVEQVMLFSGGLDSLAGAVDQVLVQKRRVALVSHKSVEHLAKKQRDLLERITPRAGSKLRPLHFPVLANRIGEVQGDHTQRTRSFLYAVLAAAVADYFGLDAIHFYENGIVSINLPLCAQEVGGRATRTTHPQTLHRFGVLFSKVLDRPFGVHNDLLWTTKEDVVRRLVKAGQGELIQYSLSCLHTRHYRSEAPHCGTCSQCLSRRMATLGVDEGRFDPACQYRADVLTAARMKDEDRILAERFVGMALQVETMRTAAEFNRHFAGELSRVYRYLELDPAEAAAQLFDLHQRHARQVGEALNNAMRNQVEARRKGQLAETCLLAYAYDGGKARPGGRERRQGAAGSELHQQVQRLNEMERCCITALYERYTSDPERNNRPGQELLARWAGYSYTSQFKSALAGLVKAGYLDNARHHGARGGYYLTQLGQRAGRILRD